uniref:Uncharacterized protein n=1 Tax=Zea mays TaxID=4577 RepID=A0A804R483_MAIZE
MYLTSLLQLRSFLRPAPVSTEVPCHWSSSHLMLALTLFCLPSYLPVTKNIQDGCRGKMVIPNNECSFSCCDCIRM